MAVHWSLLMFFLILVAVSRNNIVEGVRCEKSVIGSTYCRPCGKGSRCNSCDWCTGYCFNGQTSTIGHDLGIEYGSVEAPYKDPLLEMFNDIGALLTVDGISDQYVVDLFKGASVVTKEDCAICNNSPELKSLSIFTEMVHKELQSLAGTIQFKSKAIEKTTETKDLVQNLPDDLKIKVEPNSSILESVKNASMVESGIYSNTL